MRWGTWPEGNRESAGTVWEEYWLNMREGHPNGGLYCLVKDTTRTWVKLENRFRSHPYKSKTWSDERGSKMRSIPLAWDSGMRNSPWPGLVQREGLGQLAASLWTVNNLECEGFWSGPVSPSRSKRVRLSKWLNHFRPQLFVLCYGKTAPFLHAS